MLPAMWRMSTCMKHDASHAESDGWPGTNPIGNDSGAPICTTKTTPLTTINP